jgi:site-specific DNA-methyltransferase (adenine-specific)
MKMPEPYYEQDGIAIYHADARDLLPHLAHVDLMLTDPPYGIVLANHGRRDGRRRDRDWSVIADESQEVGFQVLALAQDRGWPTITFASPKRPWPGQWRQHLVWDKGGAVGGGGDRKTCWKMTWELIQVRGTGQLSGKRDEAVIRVPVGPSSYHHHPCQKPVKLLRYLIEKATPEDALVLDPFCGSGSTLIAAKESGRHAIGIEVEERYAEIAARRLQQAA